MRDFDVVVFGATGFAGRFVAEYLAEHYGTTVRWTVAGRSDTKLAALIADLGEINPDLNLEPIIADSQDLASLKAMAERAVVVCTTVGPYAKYGAKLVQACVESQTHYCDLTGETYFIRKMMDAHHEAAVANGTRIVHCCGYDSIPSDIGTFMAQEHAIATEGAPREEAVTVMWAAKGGFSGGTIDSIATMVDLATSDRDARRIMGHPYGLNPEGERKGADGSDEMGIGNDPDIGWTAPFLMGPINTRIVRRSNALMDYRYGKGFKYREVMRAGKGPKGLVFATSIATGMAGFMAGMVTKPTRKFLQMFLPDPGEGPSRKTIESGFFDMRTIARSPGKPNIVAQMTCDLDPGYGGTAIILAQAALCLALDDLDTPGGVTTPAAAMGAKIIPRLQDAGLTVRIL